MREGFNILIIIFFLLLSISQPSLAVNSVGTDSRIRTFVYGVNDVFRVTTTFGYQTTIEFEEDEKIRTISLGNSGYFRVTPLRNKIILRALQSNLLTNVTVITNKRTYQFEFSSITSSIDDIMYVVRFYYPENAGDISTPLPFSSTPSPSQPINSVTVPEVKLGANIPNPNNFSSPPQMSIPPMQPPMQQPMAPGINNGFAKQTPSNFNYNYTLTGAEALSPSEVFDDGIRTYVKFNNQNVPLFRILDGRNIETPANYQFNNGYYVVEAVAKQMNIYFGSEKISIYNENYGR